MSIFRGILVVAALLPLTRIIRADTLVLSDGRALFGTVVKTEGSTIWFDTAVAGIRATIPIDRQRIQKHEANDLTAEHALKPRREQEVRQDPPAGRASGSYAIIPLVGGIGEDIFAAPIEEAIAAFVQNRIGTAVLLIDTPGGRVVDAVAIADVLARHSSQIRIVSVVQNAISAGIWPTFVSHEIYMLPDAVIGGAVMYTTGTFEVDAKVSSINAAKLGAKAEVRGHSPHVVRAMIVTEASLYAYRSADGEIGFSDIPPIETADFEALDTDMTVLTLRATDADRLGIASLLHGGLKSLPDRLGLEHNTRASDRARSIHFRHASDRKKEIERAAAEAERLDRYRKELLTAIPALRDALTDAVQEANSLDPNRHSYSLDPYTRRFTPESRRNWQARTDNALRAWYRVGEIGVSLRNAISDAQKLEVSTSNLNEIDAKRFIDLANRRISELRSNRGRDR